MDIIDEEEDNPLRAMYGVDLDDEDDTNALIAMGGRPKAFPTSDAGVKIVSTMQMFSTIEINGQKIVIPNYQYMQKLESIVAAQGREMQRMKQRIAASERISDSLQREMVHVKSELSNKVDYR